MKDQINQDKSIAEHIINGSLSIDSISEFAGKMKLFPDSPQLVSEFADLLVRRKLLDAAAKSYKMAASLYIDSGKMLSALLVKILEWRIIKPSHKKAHTFYSSLRNANFDSNPVNIFLVSLSYPEMIAITNRFEIARLPAGKIIKKTEGIENNLYFISYGALRAMTYKLLDIKEKAYKKSSIYMTENHIFGDIFPFKKENGSQSYIETVTAVELGKISKPRVMRVCKKYPNVEKALINLFEAITKSLTEALPRKDRISTRQSTSLHISLVIFPEKSGNIRIVLHGYSTDISVGGVGIMLDAEYANITSVDKTLKNADIEVCFPSDSFNLNIPVTVIWGKKAYSKGEKTLALGVQFKEMTPKLKRLLVIFADMIYSDR